MGRLNDLTGLHFGKLAVIERAPNGSGGQTRWLCKCECGEFRTVHAGNLINGCTKSCGSFHCRTYDYDPSLLGKRYGNMVVTKCPDARSVMWQCTCDCGYSFYVSQNKLKSGNVTACYYCENYKDVPEIYRHRLYQSGIRNEFQSTRKIRIPENFTVTSLDGNGTKCGGDRSPSNLIAIDCRIARALSQRKYNFINNPELKLAAIMTLAVEYAAKDLKAGKKIDQYYIL